jgi:hypothetical protein
MAWCNGRGRLCRAGGKNFLRWRIRPIARKLDIPHRLVTFQVMRRTLGTDMQQRGTLKDTQGMLRHASIKTTGDVYLQTIETSARNAKNSRAVEIFSGIVLSGELPRRPENISPARRDCSKRTLHSDQREQFSFDVPIKALPKALRSQR